MTHDPDMTQPIRRTSVTLARPDYAAVHALGGYIYLATPYSDYNGGGAMGREMAYRAAKQLAGELEVAGLTVFSPIAHFHPIGEKLGHEALAHRDWLEVDAPFMRRAAALVVALMQGWFHSRGIGFEIAAFEACRRPIFFLDVDSRAIIHHVPGANGEPAL
jgi:hypothetical protein